MIFLSLFVFVFCNPSWFHIPFSLRLPRFFFFFLRVYSLEFIVLASTYTHIFWADYAHSLKLYCLWHSADDNVVGVVVVCLFVCVHIEIKYKAHRICTKKKRKRSAWTSKYLCLTKFYYWIHFVKIDAAGNWSCKKFVFWGVFEKDRLSLDWSRQTKNNKRQGSWKVEESVRDWERERERERSSVCACK